MRRQFTSADFVQYPVAAIVAILSMALAPVSAQSIWEVSPYRIEVWVALQSHPRVDAAWQKDLPERIERLANNHIGAAWHLNVRSAPAEYVVDLLRESQLDVGRLKERQPRLAELDKLMLLWVKDDPQGYRVAVREVDMLTRRWSPTLHRAVPLASQISDCSLDLLCDAFVPMVRIDRIESTGVNVAVRGGALVRPEDSSRRWQLPTQMHVGDVLQPVLVRADRNGQIGPDGVKPIEWTVLIVTEKKGSLLKCKVETGYRQPFSTRRSSRVQQLAFLMKPRLPSSTLRLVDRRDTDAPLVGYEVFSRTTEDDAASVLVGRTDWRGELTIERSVEHPVQVLFVRSGQQLLGKLPIVPGGQPLLIAPLRNDDLRLEAEGFLLGVQDSLVDLVARREVLAVRIRRAIEEGELDKADTSLRELTRLDTQDDFARRVRQRKRMLSAVDSQVQRKIDELFAQTRPLLGKYLSQEQVDELSRALAAARQNER